MGTHLGLKQKKLKTAQRCILFGLAWHLLAAEGNCLGFTTLKGLVEGLPGFADAALVIRLV